MPTNLGVLPSDKPIPNGRVQIKRGASDAGVSLTAANVGYVLLDGQGGQMKVSYTPTYPCWWIVRGNVMTHGLDGGWMRSDFAIDISPADADGVTRGFECPMQTYGGTIEWHTWAGSYMFKLNAGVAYSAYLIWAYSQGYTQQYHCGPAWCRITGRVVGEGAL
jgi:hypothetical protein